MSAKCEKTGVIFLPLGLFTQARSFLFSLDPIPDISGCRYAAEPDYSISNPASYLCTHPLH